MTASTIAHDGTSPSDLLGRLVNAVVSFEFLFLFFLVSGEFKSLPIFQPVNRLLPGERGDVAALLLVLNVLAAVYVLIRRGLERRPVVEWGTLRLGYVAAVLVFFAYMLTSYLVTPSSADADVKVLEFSTLLAWCFVVALVISDRPVRVRRFIIAYCVLALVIAGAGILRFVVGGIDVQALTGGFGTGYHRLGRMSGGTIIIGVLLYTQYHKRSTKSLLALAVTVAVAGLIVSGQRAPYVTVPLAFATLAVSYIVHGSSSKGRVSGWRILGGLFAVGAVIALLLAQTERGSYVLYRLSRIGMSPDNNVRLYMWGESLGRYLESPFLGVGFGNFSVATDLERWRQPHNLFIEMLLETGFVGLFLTGVVFFSWRALIQPVHRQSKFILVLEGLVWYTLFNAFISGDITDNRIFVVLAVMLTSVLTWNRQKWGSGRA